MKSQWTLILGFVFALIVAIFAIVNVESVEFNYLFGKTHTPLILIILISTLFGGLTVGFLGMFRIYALNKRVKQFEREWNQRGLEPLSEPSSFIKRKKNVREPVESQHTDEASTFEMDEVSSHDSNEEK